jgi:hypothetical protein
MQRRSMYCTVQYMQYTRTVYVYLIIVHAYACTAYRVSCITLIIINLYARMHICIWRLHSPWSLSLETDRESETFQKMATFKVGDYVQYKKAKDEYDKGHVNPRTNNRTLPREYKEWDETNCKYEGCGFMRVVRIDLERKTVGVIVPCLVRQIYNRNQLVREELMMDKVMNYKFSEVVLADDEPEESDDEMEETNEREGSDETLGRVLKFSIRKPRYFAVFGLPRRDKKSLFREIRGFYAATCNTATFFITPAFRFFPRLRQGKLHMYYVVGFETETALRMFREEFALRKQYLLAYHQVKPVTSENARVGMKVSPGISWGAAVRHLIPWHSSAERFRVSGFIEGTIQSVNKNPDDDCMVLVQWSDGTRFWYRAGVSVRYQGQVFYFIDLFESVGENPAVEEFEFEREKRRRIPCSLQPRKKTCHLQQGPYANAAGSACSYEAPQGPYANAAGSARPHEFPKGHRGPDVSQSSSSSLKAR